MFKTGFLAIKFVQSVLFIYFRPAPAPTQRHTNKLQAKILPGRWVLDMKLGPKL